MSATSSALTGKSRRERSVWGTTPGRPGARQPPGDGRELAGQRAEERRLATAVGAEHADALARGDRERRVAQRHGRAVGEHEALGLDEDAGPGLEIDGRARGLQGHGPGIVHPRAPPVKPRTIASAFASSLPRYVAPREPAGPSVSP